MSSSYRQKRQQQQQQLNKHNSGRIRPATNPQSSITSNHDHKNTHHNINITTELPSRDSSTSNPINGDQSLRNSINNKQTEQQFSILNINDDNNKQIVDPSSAENESISDNDCDLRRAGGGQILKQNKQSKIGFTSGDQLEAAQNNQQKLVFGLNARTNKSRHDEYAQNRRKSNPSAPSATPNLSSFRSSAPARPSLQKTKLLEAQDAAKLEPVQLIKIINNNDKNPATIDSCGNQLETNTIADRERTTTMVSKNNKQATNQNPPTGSKDPESQTTSNSQQNELIHPGAINTKNTSNTPPAPIKMQFNIPPPPPSKISSNKSSLVSYAKARIYNDQSNSKPNSNHNDNREIICTSSGLASLPSASQLSWSIIAGIKPPKQVNVSKAREKWEGGEPFAKCKSRQRLAASQQAGKRQLQLHGSWSMSSVVATQQMQFQQQASNIRFGSNSHLRPGASAEELPVKILTRGSVLERVQQYERAPSASDLVGALASEQELELIQQQQQEAQKSGSAQSPRESCFAESPVRGLTTDQYLNSLNRRKSLEELKSPTTKKLTTSNKENQLASSTHSALPHQAARIQQSSDARRLSFRRRSSSGYSLNSASNIPKFYHPNGKPNTYEIELQRRQIVACFERFPDRKASLIGPLSRRNFHQICLACGFSDYFKEPLLLYVRNLEHLWSSNLNNNLRAPIPMSKNKQQAGIERTNSLNRGPMSSNIMKLEVRSTTARAAAKQDNNIILNNNINDNRRSMILTRSASTETATPSANKFQQNQFKAEPETRRQLQSISCDQYFVCWRHLIETAFDNVARFIHLLSFGQRNYLLPNDFVPLIQSIIDDHPGLKFLGSAPDFHMRYIETVIARIYFNINKSWTGKISQAELRQSNFLAVLAKLSETEDINEITDYFSYEHFYVIYCKFWNLDQDHDLVISKEDLARHNDAAISSRIIDRIFMGIVSRQIQETNKMGYSDFVWFLIAEEDKKHTRSIEYWFRLMDIDGDGYISMYEMEYFYYEQMKRLELMDIEALPFLDCACQMLDLVNPREKSRITLSDLKRTKMVTIFFDTFINLEKYLEHESREFVSTRDVILNGKVISDWDRYASQEYESLISEETTI